jgi:hypothetical protein
MPPPTQSPYSVILPRFQVERFHEYSNLISNPANRYIYRVHPAAGRGALIPRRGFVSYGCPSSATGHYTEQFEDLVDLAVTHVTQWKNKTSRLPSPFVSASFSLAYALFEACRWNERYRCTDTQISIIDTANIKSDTCLATELVGATWTEAGFFARRAQEVLIYQFIPCDAVVATMSLDALLDCLPPWSDEVKPRILRRETCTTYGVAYALVEAARPPANHTPEVEVAVLIPSIERSIQMLRHTLPPSMKNFDPSAHADAIDQIARLASLFCWWSKWLAGVDPAAYPPLLQWVRDAVVQRLRGRKMTRGYLAELVRKRVEGMK